MPARFTDIDYVKRIIGLPGDRVELRAARLYINGVLADRLRVEDLHAPDERVPPLYLPQYIETLPDGRSYHILQKSDDGPYDTMAEVTVPPDHYFVLGADRDRSADSRFPNMEVGFVPRANLTEQPQFIYWWRDWRRIGGSVN